MQMDNKNQILRMGINSRIILLSIQYFGNLIIPDHDASVFHSPNKEKHNAIDKFIHHLLEGFVRWDGQYFIHIARYGYTYENTVAFFPLYPLTVSLLGDVFNFFLPVLHKDSILLVISITLNILLFLLSVSTLYKLSEIVFNKKIARLSCTLFCFNPASIFFIAPYTECMFSYLTFQSILNCLMLYKKWSVNMDINLGDLYYLIPIALSTLVRSNGVLNIGFFLYICLDILVTNYKKFRTFNALKFLKWSIFLCLGIVICLLPFAAYQVYCYKRFCTNFNIKLPDIVREYALENNFVLPGEYLKRNQSWCQSKVPLAYSYVQDHYWEVGFLNYYKMKQIPNFLLAAPILTILIVNCLKHVGLNASWCFFDIFSFNKLNSSKNISNIFKENIFNPVLNVFVVHGLFLSMFCALFVHIQVSTRILCSASPLFYWYCILYIKENKTSSFDGVKRLLKIDCLIKAYYLSYFVIGTVLFCNFLPWT